MTARQATTLCLCLISLALTLLALDTSVAYPPAFAATEEPPSHPTYSQHPFSYRPTPGWRGFRPMSLRARPRNTRFKTRKSGNLHGPFRR